MTNEQEQKKLKDNGEDVEMTVVLPEDDVQENDAEEEVAEENVAPKSQENAEKTAPISDAQALKEAIQEQAREDERPFSSNFTLRKILGGDILTTQIIRHQIWTIVLIVFFVILYISNRYSVQKDLLEIDRLTIQLKDAKYKALSSSSQLTEKCRESHVLEMLQTNKDSVLKMPSQPPFIVEVPEQ